MHARDYDHNAHQNIQWLGQSALTYINEKNFSDEAVRSLLIFCGRVFRENTVRKGVVPAGAASAILDLFLLDAANDLSEDERQEADFIREGIPKYITFETLEDVRKNRDEINATIKTWKEELAGIEARVVEEKSQLRKFAEQYNFVGLAHAFSNILSVKRHQLIPLRVLMIVFAIAALAPLVLQLLYGHVSIIPELIAGAWSSDVVGKLVALVGLEVIALYLFRVALQQFYGLKAQILQLELRSSLCAFIEGYVDFLVHKKVGSATEAMRSFEKLTFAPISPNEAQMPNTLDGLDQIANLVRQFKGN